MLKLLAACRQTERGLQEAEGSQRGCFDRPEPLALVVPRLLAAACRQTRCSWEPGCFQRQAASEAAPADLSLLGVQAVCRGYAQLSEQKKTSGCMP